MGAVLEPLDERFQWTKRGSGMKSEDYDAVSTVAQENLVAARILLHGEVAEADIGQYNVALLQVASNLARDPLFVRTREGTIQMTRFDAAVVWGYVCRAIDGAEFQRLFTAEYERLGVEDFPELYAEDFYYNIVTHFREEAGDDTIPDMRGEENLTDFYNRVYMGALFAFDKPDYMAVPVSQHFVLPETVGYLKSDFRLRRLTRQERDERDLLRERYGKYRGLTNFEINWLRKLYDRAHSEPWGKDREYLWLDPQYEAWERRCAEVAALSAEYKRLYDSGASKEELIAWLDKHTGGAK